MSRKIVQAFFGKGKGKTSAAVGQCIRTAKVGSSTIIIQFLKGTGAEEFGILSRLEPEIKLFRFDKYEKSYNSLSEEQQQEEKQNLLNGFNFARKVIETGECDVLVLDEILGLIELEIITYEDIIHLISLRNDYERLVLTGYHLPDELLPYCDIVSEIELLKDNT